ncbi:hypothetical protein OBBRIDRAFT_108704 [Obba rivulosa]|uniref:Uncharacterized protein n=1 Tax=Obba rivulosa TaxID=1052685 RepID=A0A8E2APB9_9APHY|nr:hypothetical protein OBBRIDRAFT_108704 [Obba rivulosa]
MLTTHSDISKINHEVSSLSVNETSKLATSLGHAAGHTHRDTKTTLPRDPLADAAQNKSTINGHLHTVSTLSPVIDELPLRSSATMLDFATPSFFREDIIPEDSAPNTVSSSITSDLLPLGSHHSDTIVTPDHVPPSVEEFDALLRACTIALGLPCGVDYRVNGGLNDGEREMGYLSTDVGKDEDASRHMVASSSTPDRGTDLVTDDTWSGVAASEMVLRNQITTKNARDAGSEPLFSISNTGANGLQEVPTQYLQSLQPDPQCTGVDGSSFVASKGTS